MLVRQIFAKSKTKAEYIEYCREEETNAKSFLSKYFEAHNPHLPKALPNAARHKFSTKKKSTISPKTQIQIKTFYSKFFAQ